MVLDRNSKTLPAAAAVLLHIDLLFIGNQKKNQNTSYLYVLY